MESDRSVNILSKGVTYLLILIGSLLLLFEKNLKNNNIENIGDYNGDGRLMTRFWIYFLVRESKGAKKTT